MRFGIARSGEMIGVDPVRHTVAIRVEATFCVPELSGGGEYEIDRLEKLALSCAHGRDAVGAIGPEGGPGRMVVSDPVERDPWVDPFDDSGRVEIVDPQN